MRKQIVIGLLIGLRLMLTAPELVFAQVADSHFYKAEACYSALLKSPDKLQFRDNWTPCIDQFKQAYATDPKGPFAAAGLFMAGKLFHELYQISWKDSDKQNAIENYQQVLKLFSRSNYIKKAREALIELTGSPEPAVARKPAAAPSANLASKSREDLFTDSKEKYKRQQSGTSSSAAPPRPPDPKPVYANPVEFSPPSGNQVLISKLRVWSNPSYTRIVIDTDGDAAYIHRLLNEDPAIGKLQRLYIDFENSRLGRDVQNIVSINDDLLQTARAAQKDPNSVRVVIDIKSFETYKIFSIRNPSRTIIDVWGSGSGTTFASASAVRREIQKPAVPPKEKVTPERLKDINADKPIKKVQVADLADQLNLGVKRIVIDPGHGGHDVGAVGYGVYEKDIVLGVAKRLKRQIQQRLKGCEVIMTRNDDRFLALEERTAIANTNNADLFISIHTNAHKNANAYGVETYFLSLAEDEESKLVARRENAASSKNLSDLEAILMDLMQTTKINESRQVAAYVQKHMCQQLTAKFSDINNKGVKRAPFYVLIGANMPSILIETSFISNRRENKRLTDPAYQEQLALGILNGIIHYIRERGPTAFYNSSRGNNG